MQEGDGNFAVPLMPAVKFVVNEPFRCVGDLIGATDNFHRFSGFVNREAVITPSRFHAQRTRGNQCRHFSQIAVTQNPNGHLHATKVAQLQSEASKVLR